MHVSRRTFLATAAAPGRSSDEVAQGGLIAVTSHGSFRMSILDPAIDDKSPKHVLFSGFPCEPA